MRSEDEYLLLSQLTHAGYCLRRSALVMNEQLWSESADTAKGHAEHERVHTQRIERRGQEIKLFEYEVFSHELGIRGKCDCIEAFADENGCRIPGVDFPVKLYPVEFKHGKLRAEEEYEIQLCAQAMCLEEMYQITISEAALFYTSSHRRYPVQLTEALRQKVRVTISALRDIQQNYTVPVAEYGPKCKKCSIRDICMPKTQRSAERYCKQLEKEAVEEVEMP
ncbi:MAG: CRISPR-associated protein Cas4 [Butyricicoccus sp.]